MYPGISVVGGYLVLMLCCQRGYAIKCYSCSNQDPLYTESCKDGTFKADEVPTVECDTSCVVVSGSQLPGFSEWFDLFDKDNNGAIATEEAAMVLTAVDALRASSNGYSEEEMRALLVGYDHGKLKVAFEKIDEDGNGKVTDEEAHSLTQDISSNTTAEEQQQTMNDFEPYVWSRNCFSEDKRETGCVPPEAGSDYTYCFCNSDRCNSGTNGSGGVSSARNSFTVLVTMTTIVVFLLCVA